jgi:hypothetical protein
MCRRPSGPDGGGPARSGEVGGDPLPPVEPGRAARPGPAERRKPTAPEGVGGGSNIPRASGRASQDQQRRHLDRHQPAAGLQGTGSARPRPGGQSRKGAEIYDGRPGREPPLFGPARNQESGTAPGEKPAQGTGQPARSRGMKRATPAQEVGTRASPATGDSEPAGGQSFGRV